MTAPHIVDPARLLGEALAEASPDLMRQLLQTMINALLCADVDAVVGAEYGRPTPGRTAQRNGYRHRDLDTRVGTIDVAIPKLRKGTYFPEWLLERRKRAETALITVVADCYLAGVSTRRMDKLVKTLGIDSLSKSQVSRMAADLDEHVEQFRHRPLDEAGPYTFVTADALTMKVREGGRVINAVVLLATGVNNDGHREVLGMRVAPAHRQRIEEQHPRPDLQQAAQPNHGLVLVGQFEVRREVPDPQRPAHHDRRPTRGVRFGASGMVLSRGRTVGRSV